jgi:hypothetical protein
MCDIQELAATPRRVNRERVGFYDKVSICLWLGNDFEVTVTPHTAEIIPFQSQRKADKPVT